MYHREPGDDLLSTDKRLKYKWGWTRIASQISKEEIKKWTHFQGSFARLNGFELEAIQWSNSDEPVYYEASINYIGEFITSVGREDKKMFLKRIDAQIGAEKLLKDWIKTQYKMIVIGK